METESTAKDDTVDWIKVDSAATDTQTDEPAAEVCGDIVLQGSLGIAEAESMHQQFDRILQAGVDISIASENLSRVDAAGVQLLYALVRQAEQNKVALRWESLSDVLRQSAGTLGLSRGMGF